ncbi:hypothetical protein G6F56_010981 [Rhizopus delemar]|nr:hypothetical protein G6F56_010981 [Rhizopus delemar]
MCLVGHVLVMKRRMLNLLKTESNDEVNESSAVIPEINANNEVLKLTESDLQITSTEFAEWEELMGEEFDVDARTNVVEYELPQVQMHSFRNNMVAFLAVFLVYYQLFYLSESQAHIVIMLADTVVMIIFNQKIFLDKLSTLRSYVGINYTYNHMRRFIVCPLCHSLYTKEQADSFLLCKSLKFGSICGGTIMETVNGKKSYIGKVAAFNDIKHTLTVMFSRPGFESLLESWRYRTRHQDTMYDIHDGQLWSEFKDKDGHIFTEKERSLLFTLNVDWFQSSKQTTYSVGAGYLTINNLPRHLRYRKENIILVCLMSGPTEPDTTQIHNYLQVMVDELNELYYDEFYRCTFKSPAVPVQIRSALFLVACDIPASRKVSGFTSFNATIPCNKCSSAYPARANTSLQRNYASTLRHCDRWVLCSS